MCTTPFRVYRRYYNKHGNVVRFSGAVDNFETLPLEIRSKFENDPFVFFEKCSKDPSILTKAVKKYNGTDNSGSKSEISSNNSISQTEDISQ